MKKVALLALLAAALAVPSIADAATPQGKLTGSAAITGVGQVTITTTITDGGVDYVGLENDKSGNCTGDSGALTIGSVAESIVCAHFVASSRDGSGPKMRFAIQNPATAECYVVSRISDGGAQGTDKVGVANICSPIALALAKAWVNVGPVGAGFGGFGNPWLFSPLTSGGFTVEP